MFAHEINFFCQQIIYIISFKIIVHYFIAKATGYFLKKFVTARQIIG
jgi:hypothetical protein